MAFAGTFLIIWTVAFFATAAAVSAVGGLGAYSTIAAASSSPSVDVGSTTVTVTSKDGAGETLSGGDVVTLNDSVSGPLTVQDIGGGLYTATASDTQTRTHTISGTINGEAITTGNAVIVFQPGALHHFTIDSISTPQTAGTPFSVTARAFDFYNNPKTDYSGTAATLTYTLAPSPSSADPTPSAPAALIWSGGVGTVAVTAKKAEPVANQTVTVADGSITRDSNSFAVLPGPLASFSIDSIATPQTAGTAFTVTARAYDEFGNAKTNYLGTNATLTYTLAPSPNNSTPTPSTPSALSWSGGVGTVAVTAKNAEPVANQTVTVADGLITRTSTGIAVEPGPLFRFAIDTPASQVAGNGFSVHVTAFDAFGNVKTDYTGSPTFSGLQDSPGCASCSPAISAAAATYGTGSWVSGEVTLTGVRAYLSAAGQAITITDGSVTKTSNTFDVSEAAASQFAFGPVTEVSFAGGQPIDTKVGAKIYSACVAAAVGSTDPCTTASTPLKVLAVDAYGNRVGNAPLGLSVASPGALTGTSTATTSTGGAIPYGEAWVSTVSINTISSAKTDRYNLVATGTGGATGAAGTSSSFRIVSDLATCTGVNKCTNTTTNGSLQKPENSFTYVKGTTGNLNLVQTTNFSDPTLDVDGQCGTVRGKSKTIGNAIDMRSVGAFNTAGAPTTTMLMMVKHKTLQFYGLTSRSAGAYDVCLGALHLDGAATGSSDAQIGVAAWRGKDKQGKSKDSFKAQDADDLYRWWGVVADCSSSFIRPTYDPCVQLKTKSASAVAAQLSTITGTTWTVADVNSKLNYFDGDIAILQRHPFPWDGKGGVY